MRPEHAVEKQRGNTMNHEEYLDHCSEQHDKALEAMANDYGNCSVCDESLLQAGGYADSGMCGPCCTGEADTFGEITEEL